jgi:hypothetical protein
VSTLAIGLGEKIKRNVENFQNKSKFSFFSPSQSFASA